MKKTKKTRPHYPHRSISHAAPQYAVYAVTADGSRAPLDACCLVVDLGGSEVEIDLRITYPILAGRLRIAARRGRLLIVGPADAGSLCVGVEAIGQGRLKPS